MSWTPAPRPEDLVGAEAVERYRDRYDEREPRPYRPPLAAPSEQTFTGGSWPSEVEAAVALDAVLAEIGLFDVHREVHGRVTQPRWCQLEQTIRIDRILVPKPALLDRGWDHGAVGVEVKASGRKVGPALSRRSTRGGLSTVSAAS